MLYRNCSQYHVPLKFKTMFTCVDQDKNVTKYPEGGEARHQAGHDHGVQWEVGGEWGGGRAGEDNGHCVSVWYPRPLRFWYPWIGGRWWGWHSVLGRGRAHQEGVTVSGGGAGYHDLVVTSVTGVIGLHSSFSSFRPTEESRVHTLRHTHKSTGE